MGRSVVIFGSIPKSNFLRLVGLRHFALFYRFLCAKVFNQYFFLCDFCVCNWKNADIKD